MVSSFINSIFGRFKGNKEVATAGAAPEHRPAPRTLNQFARIVEEIDRMIAGGEIINIKKKEQGLSVIYYMGDKKVINISKTGDPPKTIFLFAGANHVARELNISGLRALSKNEARSKGYGPAKALYTGTDPEVIRNMVKSIK